MYKRIKTLQKRDLNILINVIMAFIIKGGAVIVSIFTIPAYIRYFDNDTLLGVWFTILSVLSWILNFDFGIGNGLRNRLVETFVVKDYKKARQYISSAYIIITFSALAVALIVYILCPSVNWNLFFNISELYISANVLLKTVRIVLLGILLQFVLRVVTSILYALQHSFVPNLLNLLSSIMLLLFALYSTSKSPEQNIVMLAYANLIAVNLPLLIATIVVFAGKLRNCLPGIKWFKKEYAVDIMKLGGAFLWLQIMAMILFSTNEYLITWFLSPDMVVDYQIYNKIFTLGGVLIALAMTPIWSAVTKAQFEKNYEWIKKLNNRLVLLGIVGICIELVIVPVTQVIINFWLGENAITVNNNYAIIFAISGSLFLWSNIIASMTNGLGELRIQLIFVSLGAIVNIPLAYIGAELLGSYIAIVIANIISITPFCIIQPIWFNHFIKRKIQDTNVIECTNANLTQVTVETVR